MLNIAFNPLKAELNPIRRLLALVGAQHIFHVGRVRANKLSLNKFLNLLSFHGILSGYKFINTGNQVLLMNSMPQTHLGDVEANSMFICKFDQSYKRNFEYAQS